MIISQKIHYYELQNYVQRYVVILFTHFENNKNPPKILRKCTRIPIREHSPKLVIKWQNCDKPHGRF